MSDQPHIKAAIRFAGAVTKLLKNLTEQELPWAGDFSRRPGEHPIQNYDVKSILEDITNNITTDELERYARERDSNHYFQAAWGENGVEKFCESRDFFKRFAEASNAEDHIDFFMGKDSAKEAGFFLLPSKVSLYPDIPKQMREEGTIVKQNIAALEHHLGCYVGALKYQKRILSETISFAKMFVPERKGEHWQEHQAEGEDIAAEFTYKLQNHLAEKGLEDPILAHHMHSALQGAYNVKGKFQPKMVGYYFTALQAGIDNNIEQCGSIIAVCKTTRMQIDQKLKKHLDNPTRDNPG